MVATSIKNRHIWSYTHKNGHGTQATVIGVLSVGYWLCFCALCVIALFFEIPLLERRQINISVNLLPALGISISNTLTIDYEILAQSQFPLKC